MKKVFYFAFVILCMCFPVVSYGQLITIQVEATVNYYGLVELEDVFNGTVTQGTQITGTYTYDTSIQDIDLSENGGIYASNIAPCGISFNVGNTLIEHTYIEIQLINSQDNDIYFVFSGVGLQFNNLDTYVYFALEDYTGNALLTDDLPVTAPTLSEWTYTDGLIIEGVSNAGASFCIGATIDSLTLIPEPATLALLTLGGLVLSRKK